MGGPDKEMLGRFGATFLVIILFSAAVDPVVRIPFLAGGFLLASLAAIVLAAMRKHTIRSRSLTYWDQALAFFAASRVFHLLTDPESYEAVRQLSQTSGAP